MRRSRDRSGAVELQIAEAGSGHPTVLLIPAFGSGLDAYEDLIEAMSADRRVVALSVRGHGTSGWSAPYAIVDWVDDVVRVARSVAGARVVVVGHSFGAILSLAAAAREPGLFDGVISLDQIVDVPVFVELAHDVIPFWQHVRQAIERAAGDAGVLVELLGDVVSPATRDRAARHWAPQDPAVFDAIVPEQFDAWALDPSITDLPGSYRGPVLFVDGDPSGGSIVSAELAARNLALYPWADRIQLDGADHWLDIEENPSLVADVISDYLEQQGGLS